jgi:hypothetical protein
MVKQIIAVIKQAAAQMLSIASSLIVFLQMKNPLPLIPLIWKIPLIP